MDYREIENTAFAPADEATWRKLAEKALKGADFDAALVSRSDDDIAYGPIYTRSASPAFLHRIDADNPWSVCQRVDDPDASRASVQIAEDLQNGADSLMVCLEGAPSALGFGASADIADRLAYNKPRAIWLDPGADFGAASKFSSIEGATLYGGLDPWCVAARFGVDQVDPAALAPAARALGGVALKADGRVVHNAGGTEGQELAFILASMAENLRLFEAADIAPGDVFAMTALYASVDQDQFLSTARLRALRQLAAAMQKACAVAPVSMPIHAETSLRMLTRQDAETGVLRNTIAAFAAGIGGADAVTVLPHSWSAGLPEAAARRLARNTQIVLIEESRLDHVLDPMAGAGGVEYLTSEIAAVAWRLFQEIEAEGGLLASLTSGAFQSRVHEARAARFQRIEKGERPIIGTTLYPPAAERPLDVYEKTAAPETPAMDAKSLAPAPLYLAAEGEAA
ncbi:methylmalonyl-CoA mutase [Hoeflea sp. WL0058]|uniref:Methylmalonyl-CoA mutase n=1 Tax=Flavimaribacter sediminis TaxID=2865987 RepID=A0AAE3D397_9HYPH|nr:methylmalonyl-CoA mutase family protein [Flavimaribacter sediminis]MBW8639383.1 methylmalonyl-CoA mutase [Flavimaribacter sediminis]